MRLALVAAVTLLLAGCATPAAVDGEPPPNASVEAAAAPPPVDDGARTDLGHMPHMHDYWKGKERVTLFEGEVDPKLDPFDTLFRVGVRKEVKLGGAGWLPPEGAIVFEGTGQLALTASWSDPKVSSLAVSFRAPDSQTFRPAARLEPGKTLVVEVTPAMTDMPHSKTSRWAFAFAPAESPGAALGPFDLKVEIVKLRDIGLFPPHPELFEGKPEKILHDEEHAHSEVSYAKRVPMLLTTGEFGEKEVTPKHLVPMETVWMRVELHITSASASPGQVSDIRFFHKGADRSAIGHPTTRPTEGSLAQKRLVYEFPVTMEETDTPYGNESQWRFFVEPTTTFSGQDSEPDCGGCSDVSIAYRLKVIAYDHVPEGADATKG